jgi:hypothetical protein
MGYLLMSLTMVSSLIEKGKPHLPANLLLFAIERHPPNQCERCRTIDQAGYMLQDQTFTRKFFCLACLNPLLVACVDPEPTANVTV